MRTLSSNHTKMTFVLCLITTLQNKEELNKVNTKIFEVEHENDCYKNIRDRTQNDLHSLFIKIKEMEKTESKINKQTTESKMIHIQIANEVLKFKYTSNNEESEYNVTSIIKAIQDNKNKRNKLEKLK